MGLRCLQLTTVYSQFSDPLLGTMPALDAMSYRELYGRIVASRFAEADAHTRQMQRLGHAARTHFVSIEPLQRKWAAEREVRFRGADWTTDIAVEQVRAFAPDVIYIEDLYAIDRPFRRRLLAACRRRPLLVGWRAAPTDDYSRFDDVDLMLTSIPTMAEDFRKQGVNARLLHHGFDPSIHQAVEPRTDAERDIEFSFAGGLGPLHPERTTLVDHLLRRTPLEVWGHTHKLRSKDRVRWWMQRAGWTLKPKHRMRTLPLEFPGRIHPPAFGLDYFDVLGRSQIVLNRHIACAGPDAANMRLFEATGMGACLLTDAKRNLAEMFEPDVEVVTYRSAEECVEKVKYLLENPDVRESIAAAGRQRTLTEHTYANRVASFLRIVGEQAKAKAA